MRPVMIDLKSLIALCLLVRLPFLLLLPCCCLVVALLLFVCCLVVVCLLLFGRLQPRSTPPPRPLRPPRPPRVGEAALAGRCTSTNNARTLPRKSLSTNRNGTAMFFPRSNEDGARPAAAVAGARGVRGMVVGVRVVVAVREPPLVAWLASARRVFIWAARLTVGGGSRRGTPRLFAPPIVWTTR